MSENTSHDTTSGLSSNDNDGYDPAEDQDSDPESLQPRTGSEAGAGAADTHGDPDADPDMLNPRGSDAG